MLQTRRSGLVVGFSFKVAPGVRIRASSRGVRTSIGLRAGRRGCMSGGGRVGFSPGVGPVGYYTSLSGPRRGGGSCRRVAAGTRASRKQDQAQQLRQALSDLLNLHR